LTDVRCPICNQTISGEGIVDLSLNLQAHMGDVHEVKGLCDLGSRSATPGHGTDPWTEVREEDLSPLSFEDEAIKESHGPVERRLPGEDVPQAVRCPFCGEMVRGFAFDDFSYNLAKHVNFAHQIKVRWSGKG
jgi:uncharacterized C2H2 Zn-finger protein